MSDTVGVSVKSRTELFVKYHNDKPRKIFCSKELSAAVASPLG